MSFLRKFSVLFSNELDKSLFFLLNSDPDTYLNEEQYIKFTEFLSGKNQRFPKSAALSGFFKSMQKAISWQGGLRHLMVMHKLIHEFGEECYQWIATDSMKSFHKFKSQDSPLKTFVYKAMVGYYYNYLNKLSYNYEDYSICFHLDEEYPNKLLENNISPLHSLSKLQNILRYLIQIFSLFEASLVELTPCLLVKQITYFCFTDCYHFYTYINQVISSLIIDIFSLPNPDAILLYELYSDHIIITRKIQANYQVLKEKLQEFSLKIPNFFTFDAKYNTKIELFIRSIKTNRPRITKAQTLPVVRSLTCNNDDSFISVKDVSRVIADYISSNTDDLYRKNIFEAPRNLIKKKKGNNNNGNRRIFPSHDGDKILCSLPTQMGNRLQATDKSIEIQNTCVEISTQFEQGTFTNREAMQQQLGQSNYPLAGGNQSFLPEDNNGLNISMGVPGNTSFQEGL